MKKLLFIFLLQFSFLELFAQIHQVTVKNEVGASIGFVALECSRNKMKMISDEKGVVHFECEYFKPDDVIKFHSIFFHDKEVRFKEILSVNEIILQARSFELSEVYVISDHCIDIHCLIDEMSMTFSQKYAKNYIADMERQDILKCKGRVRQFVGTKGVFLSEGFNQKSHIIFNDDKNRLCYIPKTIMRSDAFHATSDSIIPFCDTYAERRFLEYDRLKMEFQDFDDSHALLLKRSLEIYSPLNPKQVKYYDYELMNVYVQDRDTVCVIDFKTKENCFPRKTKLLGRGRISYNRTKQFVETIEIENHQDYHATTRYSHLKELLPMATSHRIEVCYSVFDQSIYTKSILLDIDWVQPTNIEDYYSIKMQARANPIENELEEHEYCEFSNIIILDQEMVDRISPHFSYCCHDKIGYVAPYTPIEWINVAIKGFRKEDVFKDLETYDETIYQQAIKNMLKLNYFIRGERVIDTDYQLNYYKKWDVVKKELEDYVK